ncbi:dihydroorotase [Tenacibaculum sp. AHE15PA]|uniref:dihydroorotase n=1 Tax=unclassified Tenacibaculum TaxID=2635139 RepID=UPI001C4F520F|nr:MULTISPECIES: dihydroorotase [unclassified Tenacibaculum]QXP74730.1 dihydroorotase [Tenacibaculum sp. AHE14PA]QXP76241.1 dihydroorotase [Tenacibaculum sp. AHE15PA]
MTTLLKSATIIDASSPYHQKTKDILITDGIITKINDTITSKKEYQVLKLDNLHVSTGWFDTSVSFGEPGYEERETVKHGLLVAAKSGFTAVAVNPNTNPVIDNKSAVEFLINKANGFATNLYPIGTLTQQSKGVEMAELYDMQQSGAIAFGDYNKPIANDNLLKVALLYTQNFNGLAMSFPKNNSIAGEGVVNEGKNSTLLGLKGIPALAEELQISRDLFLLEYTGGKLHIPTISTKKSVQLIKDAKKKGLDVTCSVAVHNLFLTDDELHDFDGNKKVNPPLRTSSDIKALLKGVKDGTIDMITSDHNPIDIEHKKVEFSEAKDGTIGLESAFGVLNSVLDLETIVNCLSNNPKERFELEKASIKENEKANLSIFNPDGSYTFSEENIFSTSKNSAFLDKELKGKVYGIYNNNQLILNS